MSRANPSYGAPMVIIKTRARPLGTRAGADRRDRAHPAPVSHVPEPTGGSHETREARSDFNG